MAKPTTHEKKNAAEIVTAKLIEIIETTGRLPWNRPWLNQAGNGAPRNLITGKVYQGVNLLLLSAVQGAAGYASPYWLTFKQAMDKGGMVRKGERGTPICYFNLLSLEDRVTGEEKTIPLLKYSTIFNVSQCDNVPYPAIEAAPVRTFDSIEEAERILAAMPLPPVKFGGNRAYYSPELDYIQLPTRAQFGDNAAGWYATYWHEAAHSTGSKGKLARKGVTDPIKFGSSTYSVEELIAEVTSAALCDAANLSADTEKNSAAYVKSWCKALNDDKGMIIKAAGAAQKAFNFLMNIEPEAATVAPEPVKLAA